MNSNQKCTIQTLRNNGASFDLVMLPEVKGATQIRTYFPKLVMTIADNGNIELCKGHKQSFKYWIEDNK